MPTDHVKSEATVNTTIRFSRKLWKAISRYADDVGASRQSTVVILLREILTQKGYGPIFEGDNNAREDT